MVKSEKRGWQLKGKKQYYEIRRFESTTPLKVISWTNVAHSLPREWWRRRLDPSVGWPIAFVLRPSVSAPHIQILWLSGCQQVTSVYSTFFTLQELKAKDLGQQNRLELQRIHLSWQRLQVGELFFNFKYVYNLNIFVSSSWMRCVAYSTYISVVLCLIVQYIILKHYFHFKTTLKGKSTKNIIHMVFL